jgi:hypothetical protein
MKRQAGGLPNIREMCGSPFARQRTIEWCATDAIRSLRLSVRCCREGVET